MVAGGPSVCIAMAAAPVWASSGSISASNRKALMSLTTVAPAASAASATAALVVSTEMGTAVRAPSPRITGTTRAICSAGPTGALPGRVDSPPTSRMSAPSATKRRPCAMAASASRY
jgi:hypothetical protein